MSALSKVQEMKAAFEKLKQEFQQTCKDQFKLIMLELFAEHPTLNKISWTQYTPGFNDGDPCTFRANIDASSIKLNGFDKYGDGDDEDEYDEEDNDDETEVEPLNETVYESVSAVLETFGEDVLLEMFDDNQRVTVSRDGTIKQEEYDCGY